MKAESDGDKKVCRCPDNSVPEANGACAQRDGACDTTQFTCAASNTCIPLLWKCDGDDDCGDG